MWDIHQSDRVDDIPLTSRQLRIDVLLAIGGLCVAVGETVVFSDPSSSWDLLVLMGATVAPVVIAVRRVFPIEVFLVLGITFVTALALGQLLLGLLVATVLTVWPAATRLIEYRPSDLVQLAARPGNAIWADGLLAAAAAAIYVVALTDTDSGRSLAPLVGVCAAVLVFHRTAPITACAALAQVCLLSVLTHAGLSLAIVFLGIGYFSLAHQRRLLVALPVAINLLAYIVAMTALALRPQEIDGTTIGVGQQLLRQSSLLAMTLVALVSLSIGALVRVSRIARASAVREAVLERQAVEHEEIEAVMTERATIARDLHDVVAHHVSLIVLQSETGPDLVGQGEGQAMEGFERIGDAGRRALDELDRMLVALRATERTSTGELGPSPGLAELRDLVTEVRRSDTAFISLVLQGVTDAPPAGHQLAAYRIVQEALTNMVRYANATTVTVTIEISSAAISIQVVDDGIGFDPHMSSGGGHGLLGMRERARIHGGTLAVISSPGHGTTIHARLPIEMVE